MDAENLIRERAYLLWERSGRPDGRSEAFWLQAVAEIAATQAPEPAAAAKKAAVRRKAATAVAARTTTAPAPTAITKAVSKAAAKTGAAAAPAGMLSP